MPTTLMLYHGTTHDLGGIDIRRGKPYKDFGQGFYLTRIYEHARNIAIRNRSIELERLRVIGAKTDISIYVYVYEFEQSMMDGLKVKHFESADHEWLKFVIENRTSRNCRHDYDIVIGPTANDDTRASIRAIMNMSNGSPLEDAALDLLLGMLKPSRLPEQYFFGTDRATALLKVKERRQINERT